MQTIDPAKAAKAKYRLIKHIRFRLRLSEDEHEDLLSQRFFENCGGSNLKPWKQLSGFAEYEKLSREIAHFAAKVDEQPENLVLLQALTHELVKEFKFLLSDDGRSLAALAKF